MIRTLTSEFTIAT